MLLALLARTILLLHLLAAAGAVCILLLSLLNILWLRSSSFPPASSGHGKVSVLIPARNEEQTLPRCLDSLLDQSYGDYEILVLDDLSTDRTWEVLSRYAAAHPQRIRAVRGEPLPERGWAGKTHAMQLLSAHARGEYLLFTDADTVHGPDSIAWAVSNLVNHRVDFLSGYVQLEVRSFGESLIVPVTYIMSTMVMPLWLIPSTGSPHLSFAVGQYVMFTRRLFEAIGGYRSVAGQISEDVFIAREVKRAGFRATFLDIRRHVRCRMYRGYRAAFQGIGKNIYDFFKNQPLFFAAVCSMLVAFIVLPVVLVPIELLSGSPFLPLTGASVLSFLLAWSLALYDRGQKWWIPLLYPLSFLHLLYMAWRSFGRVASGVGVMWKGRVFK